MTIYDRRSFLKGLAGITAAGAFVITNPHVIAGDLLVPSPEPTIIRADQPLQRVGGPVVAWLKSASVTNEPFGLTRAELILEVSYYDNGVPELAALWQKGKVTLYPGWEKQL